MRPAEPITGSAIAQVAVRTDQQQPPASPIVLTGGLLLALFLVGWSFVRR